VAFTQDDNTAGAGPFKSDLIKMSTEDAFGFCY